MLPRQPPDTACHTDPADLNDAASSELPAVLASALVLATLCVAADTASLTTVDRAEQLTTYASNDVAAKADRLQYDLGTGPCLTAVHTATPVTIADVTAEPRWPEWASAARGLGVSGLLSIPLPDSGASESGALTGSLNLYSFEPRACSAGDVQTAQLVAAHAATLLDAHHLRHQLVRAVDSRTVIGQVQGILVERYRITPAAAFAVLRRYSQYHNVKLKVAAAELVATGRLPKLAAMLTPISIA